MDPTHSSPSLAKLELPEILDRLARACRFSLSAALARQLGPSSDREHVAYLLAVTRQAVDALAVAPDLPWGSPKDISGQIQRAEKGGRLGPHDLLAVGDTLSSSRQLGKAIVRLPDAPNRFSHLLDFADGLIDAQEIERSIARTVNVSGEILDSASEELARIRREIRLAQGRLTDRLNAIVAAGKSSGALQDAIITSRDGRFVVPVKSEARAQIPGIVHDVSASGQTLFVEPQAVVELNNAVREARVRETREIDRILDMLSAAVGDRAFELHSTVRALAAIDLALAKARLAGEMGASEPTLEAGGAGRPTRIRFLRARHPLLDQRTVVPVSITAGDAFRVLVITGPNTGGKTVALKTVGLLCAMAQTGLFLPVDPGSSTSVFTGIYADIGDEQSIAQNLSTFSSHMRTVIAMLGDVSSTDLVLLDELGAGTDPQEGSALARALLTELLRSGPLTVATTHYSEIKAFAYATPGVENASVEFDLQTLGPTYRLTIGIPGQSNAIAIARRLGMPERILRDASSLVDPNTVRADVLLQEIQERRQEADRALARAKQVEGEAKQLRREALKELRNAEDERRSARELALAEAEDELRMVRDLARRLERERQTASALAASPVVSTPTPERRQAVESAAETVQTFRREFVPARKLQESAEIRAGDRVQILSLDEEAEVLGIEGDYAEVSLGSLKMRMPLDGLKRLGRAKSAAQGNERRTTVVAPTPVVSLEIDLRGMRAAEIAGELGPYLDNAYRGGLPFVRIIHGKGTGALREVVRTTLKVHPGVERFELAGPGEGGDGATVAFFRDV